MLAMAPFSSVFFLGYSLTFMMVYVWGRRNETFPMNFLGLFNFPAPWLPWVLLAFSALLGASPVPPPPPPRKQGARAWAARRQQPLTTASSPRRWRSSRATRIPPSSAPTPPTRAPTSRSRPLNLIVQEDVLSSSYKKTRGVWGGLGQWIVC